ncbi:unnamed protein product [Dicrocoelium dendriticum]|nr:unnamed protein product [Dicrocoelium dendriticum]
MSGLRLHEQSVHLRERPHACVHCGKSFPRRNHLQRHISSVHLEQKAHSYSLKLRPLEKAALQMQVL